MTGVDKRHGDAEKTAPFSLFLRGNDAFKLSLKIKKKFKRKCQFGTDSCDDSARKNQIHLVMLGLHVFQKRNAQP